MEGDRVENHTACILCGIEQFRLGRILGVMEEGEGGGGGRRGKEEGEGGGGGRRGKEEGEGGGRRGRGDGGGGGRG